jgi:hypothetical protein
MDETSWNNVSGEVKDSSGNGNNGTGSGYSTTSLPAGKYGNAGTFNGSNQYVSIPDNSNLGSSYMTVSAWIYTSTFNTNGSIYNRRTADNTGGVTMQPYNTSGNIICYFYIGGIWVSVATSIALPVSQWGLITYTYDGSTIKAYVNGIPAGSTSVSGTINNPTSPLVQIGKNVTSATTFNGLIDEVRIYNRALSASEVQQLYLSSGVGRTGVV